MTISSLKKDLRKHINEERKEFLPKFFRTGKGEYGEGDKFLGVVVPDIAKVANKYSDITKEDIRKLLNSPWHEERFCGWLVVLNNFNKSKNKDDVFCQIFDLLGLDEASVGLMFEEKPINQLKTYF